MHGGWVKNCKLKGENAKVYFAGCVGWTWCATTELCDQGVDLFQKHFWIHRATWYLHINFDYIGNFFDIWKGTKTSDKKINTLLFVQE
jgi:hypothetical protein